MNGAAGDDVVLFDFLVVGELFPRVDQPNLVDLDPLLLLQRLLDRSNLVGRLEGHRLLPAGQGLDKDLHPAAQAHRFTVPAPEAA
eukprot:CAMPEP_0197387248 /NCGR_PEP_ID=MMETSP1165-20131217/414_1 /TAXON_ID=284809 /ORGANISM="Chrysocystis fragilis, Strain CCMP3189" /LENGTH=84 /DNA_ID=CAMNT_0042912561 /DNA_START=180 /DNA_END=431 /DNA_ORIENTATION=-